MEIELGKRAKDKITGMVGVITGRSIYIYGCDQYLLSPQSKDGNTAPDSCWFDEGRIEVLGDGIKAEEVKADKPGGPQQCPVGKL